LRAIRPDTDADSHRNSYCYSNTYAYANANSVHREMFTDTQAASNSAFSPGAAVKEGQRETSD
jgi:hypothetical protein